MSEAIPRVLLVDDDESIRSLLQEYLQLQGFLVVTACDGRDALRLACESRYDIILSDVKMPRLDGLQLIKELLRAGCDAPIVLMTGYSSEETVSAARAAGARECLSKPFRLRELEQVLRSLLASP